MGVVRKVLLSVIAALALGVVPAASAGGPFMFVGAADDVVVQRDPVLAQSRTDLAKLAGLDTLRLSVQWSRGQTELEGPALEGLENAVTAAKLDGIRIVLSLYPLGSSVTPLTDADRADFAAWATDVVQRFP